MSDLSVRPQPRSYGMPGKTVAPERAANLFLSSIAEGAPAPRSRSRQIVCVRCDEEFIFPVKNGRPPTRCDPCRPHAGDSIERETRARREARERAQVREAPSEGASAPPLAIPSRVMTPGSVAAFLERSNVAIVKFPSGHATVFVGADHYQADSAEHAIARAIAAEGNRAAA